MTGEIFGQLPAREVVGTDHAMHDARFLEDDEIAVHGALRELAPPGEDLRDREGTGRGREGVDERLAVGGEALPHTVKTRRRRFANVFQTRGHGRRLYRRPLRSASVDPTERFTDLLQNAESDIALDEACFLIAAHARPDLDVDERRAQLDALAASLDADDADALAHALFTDLGYAGNTIDYADPDNSYLDAVLDRRLGIPITLSVLMIEVGRRRGIELHGVGMPGHFLVGVGADQWYDPFHGGRARLRRLRRALRRAPRPGGVPPIVPRTRWSHRDPRSHVGESPALVDRARAGARVWPTRLRLRIPGISAAQRAELAALLGSLGHFSEAATELDTLARDLPGSGGEQAAQAAARFRARAN